MKTIIKHYSIARLARIGMVLLFAVVVGSCGGGGGCAGVVNGVNTCASGTTPPPGGTTPPGVVSLVFSSTELKSAGASGTEVTITATVKTAANVALPGVSVNFSSDSGNLTVLSGGMTDANGRATAQIGTAGNHVNRIITVTAQAGTAIATGTIAVVGTTVTVSGPASITFGTTGDFTVTVKDSLAAAVANVPVTFSSALGNAIAAVNPPSGSTAAAPLTNSTGQVVFRLTGTTGPSDTLSFASQGANAAQSVAISSSSLTVTTFDASNALVTQANTGTCTRITAHYMTTNGPGSGSVNISTSRGNMFSDGSCTAPLAGPVAFTAGGDSTPTYVKSPSAGVATITATVVSAGPSALTNLEFTAPLTAASTITLQADPSVIGPNSGTSQAQQSTLTAIVRDSTCTTTSPCNLVKNALVAFNIVSDPSGGTLSNPSPVTTGSNGAAVTTYIAGPAGTPTNGVVVRATIQGAPTTTASATTTLTVSRQALFISAGSSSTLVPIDALQYQKQFIVRVTDASGNAVSGVTLTGSIIPTTYGKGLWKWDTTKNMYLQYGITCVNEDTNKNGILDPGEDVNGNKKLDPGIPLSVTANTVTGADGTALINVTYPRDRAYWLEVTMTITGSVAGSESIYQTTFTLTGLASDYVQGVNPPGNPSPYGTASVCTDPT
jgi:hypothetical protein